MNKNVGRPKKEEHEKTQRVQLRIKPELLEYAKKNDNVSKYICSLIEKDMKAA